MAPTACRRMVSGTISLSSSECFSPFPHGTRSLSVSREYLALPDGPGGFAQDSSCPALLRIPIGPGCIRVRDYHPLRCNFPDASTLHSGATSWSFNPGRASPHARFGLLPVRSPLLGESLLFSLPGGTKMFQFPPLASAHIKVRMTVLQTAGLSHSDTAGSRDICSSPALFAAYRVLHRLREPRHPPCALSYFRHAGKTNNMPPQAHTFSCMCEIVCPLPAAYKHRGGSDRPQRRKGRRPSQSCLCQNVKDRG